MLGALGCVFWRLDGKAPWAPKIQPKPAAVIILAHAVDLVGRWRAKSTPGRAAQRRRPGESLASGDRRAPQFEFPRSTQPVKTQAGDLSYQSSPDFRAF